MSNLATITQLKAGVRRDAEGRYNLTDLWKLAGSPGTRAAKFWLDQDTSRGFLSALGKFQKVTLDYLLQVKRGRSGGTWGHEQVFVEYAQYLDPRLVVLVNQAFIERVQEEANPELALQRGRDRAISGWKRQGKEDRWIEDRIRGVETRRQFTKALAQHGVTHDGFRNCTNAIYTPLYGGTAAVVRMKKGITKSASIRDNMSQVELTATHLAELLAQEKIQVENIRGNAPCEVACSIAAQMVATAIVKTRKS